MSDENIDKGSCWLSDNTWACYQSVMSMKYLCDCCYSDTEGLPPPVDQYVKAPSSAEKGVLCALSNDSLDHQAFSRTGISEIALRRKPRPASWNVITEISQERLLANQWTHPFPIMANSAVELGLVLGRERGNTFFQADIFNLYQYNMWTQQFNAQYNRSK